MPAIQAMRSDALALRAKEDVQEKIPSFFNSVNQSLGQAIVTGQDAAEQLLESRFSAANGVIAQVRQKVSGQGGIAELTAGAGLKIISSALNIVLMIFSKTTTTDIIQIASDIANFMIERKTLQLSWDAAAATYAQWVVQAGYAGQDNGTFFKNTAPPPPGQIVNPRMSVTQWLKFSGTTAGFPSGTLPNANFLSTLGSFTNSAPPAAPVPYQISIDTDGDAATPNELRNATVTMDAFSGSSDNGTPDLNITVPANSSDGVASVYRQGSDFYLLYTYEFQPGPAVEGTSIEPPTVTGSVTATTVTIPGPPSTTSPVLFSNPTMTPGGAGDGSSDDLVYNRVNRSPIQRAMGARGALKYRDAFTPRFTDRRHYAGSALGGVDNYDSYYAWGSVGSISRIGREP